MDRPGNQLFAGAALAGDEDGDIGRGDALYGLDKSLEARTVTDDGGQGGRFGGQNYLHWDLGVFGHIGRAPDKYTG